MPSLLGFPGLWKTIGADALPAGSFGATGWMDRINRNPGQLTITTSGSSWFASLHRRVALAGQFNANRRILVRRADQLSFGQSTLRHLGKGGCPEPNCFPTNLLPIGFPATPVPVASPASIPLLFDPHSLSRIPLNQAGFHELYPLANRRLNTDVAEVVFAGHINLVDAQGGRGMAVALRPHIAIPTETESLELLSNGVQTGGVQGGVDVLFEGHAEDMLGAYVNVGYTHRADPDEVDLRNVVPVRVGFNLPRTSRLQLLTEFTLDTFVGDGTATQYVRDGFENDTTVDGTIGFRGYLAPWFSVSAGYRRTLNQFGGDKNGFVFQLAAAHVSVPLVPPPTSPTLSCRAEPTKVYIGGPITLSSTGSASSGTLTYTWATTAGRIVGTGATVKLDTTGVAPGTYTATVRADDGRGGFADCTVHITVEAPPPPKPPVVTCSGDKSSVASGEVVNVQATASSPDNRPLSYDWTASDGQIEGNGAAVRWDTSGLQTGTYTATVRVSDDRGLSADCTVAVDVQEPPPPPKPAMLSECAFGANSPRVDNVCKAILDDAALRLQSELGSQAVLVGDQTSQEKRPNLAAQRASNVKAYLVAEKGIAAARIQVRVSTEDAAKVQIWLVPQGASLADVPGKAAPEQPTKKRRRR